RRPAPGSPRPSASRTPVAFSPSSDVRDSGVSPGITRRSARWFKTEPIFSRDRTAAPAGRPEAGRGSGHDDAVAFDLHGVLLERLLGGALPHGAVRDRELAAMAGAADQPALDLVHRAPLVGAHGRERLEGALAGLGHDDLVAAVDLASADRDVGGLGDLLSA